MFLVALLALIVSALALGVAGWAAWKSAKAGDRSATAAERSALVNEITLKLQTQREPKWVFTEPVGSSYRGQLVNHAGFDAFHVGVEVPEEARVSSLWVPTDSAAARNGGSIEVPIVPRGMRDEPVRITVRWSWEPDEPATLLWSTEV